MKTWFWTGGVTALTLPALYLRFQGLALEPWLEATVFGLAILGGGFLLSWGAEVAQKDISQSLALAFLAIVAVLPEYAVDLYFAWAAGSQPSYTSYAAANMTGANRLLVGLGWPLVVLLWWIVSRSPAVVLEKAQRTELAFLGLATLYCFLLPLKASISLLDSAILIPLFLAYLWRASRQKVTEPELVEPSRSIALLPTPARRGVTAFLFLYAALVILASAEPFSEGLVRTGKTLGVDEFILVQWLAPVASEAPEIFIVTLLTLKGLPRAGMTALISSKLNHWALLVGSLALVYSLSLGRPAALPLDARQVEEVFLTAAQSAFGLAVLAKLSLSLRGAALLFLLFSTQLALPSPLVRYGYAFLYLLLTLILLIGDRGRLRGMVRPIYQGIEKVKNTPKG